MITDGSGQVASEGRVLNGADVAGHERLITDDDGQVASESVTSHVDRASQGQSTSKSQSLRCFIGLRLDVAVQRLENCATPYRIDTCDSDKLKRWDSQIVVKAIEVGGLITLTAANFYMTVEGDSEQKS